MKNFLKTTATAAAAAALLFTGTAASQASEDTELALDVLEHIEIREDCPSNEAVRDDMIAENRLPEHCPTDDYYDRDEFAPSDWIDADGTGCDTHEDVRMRDFDPDTIVVDGDCRVLFGEMQGPYLGERIEYNRYGNRDVDTEHVVAVAQAWRNGAYDWDEETKQEFYQDKDNLVMVDESENGTKSSDDITSYLPPNQGVHCEFAATKVFVKDKYDLAMNQDEYGLIQGILNDPECDGTPAAPAQAMVTSDWESAPEAGSNTGGDSALPDFVEDQEPGFWAIAGGIALVVLIAVARMFFRPKRRRS